MKHTIGLILIFCFISCVTSQETMMPLDNSTVQSVVVVSTESIKAVSEITTNRSNCVNILVGITYLQQIALVGNNQLTVHFDPNYPPCNPNTTLRQSYLGYRISSQQVPFFISLTCDLSETIQASITQTIINQSSVIFNRSILCSELAQTRTLILDSVHSN